MHSHFDTIFRSLVFFTSTASIVILSLIATILLWLSNKLWKFRDGSFKSAFYVTAFVLVVVIVGEYIKSKLKLTFPPTLILGFLTSVIASKKLFQESLIKSLGTTITSYALLVIIVLITSIAFAAIYRNLLGPFL